MFSSGGPLGAAPRVAKEQSIAPPHGEDYMEIEGFPYFRVTDQKAYQDWCIGIAPRPSTHDIIERYPIQVIDVMGSDITGDEIGVYTNNDDLYTFDHDRPADKTINRNLVRVFMTESNVPLAINPSNVYQVVIFDRDKLGSHLTT